MKRDQDHFRGCLLGGAIGDALGAPVEFLSLREIKKRYGDMGVTDLLTGPGGKAEITDDTQMTLFTAEGILRAAARWHQKGICHAPSVVYFAYLRWLHTQGYSKSPDLEWIYDGWLLEIPELYKRRAPGQSCLSALSSGKRGTIQEPVNDSKGCGGVMRVAPVGLFCPRDLAFSLACECAALTHGHPSGYLSAGALAYVIASIIEGQDIESAVRGAIAHLKDFRGHEECVWKLVLALELAESDVPDIEAIGRIGEGWVGEEALAIAIYCTLKHADDFREPLIAAVNHDGDSDSTGAITGNILGAYLGLRKIPRDWVEKVELKDVLLQVADDLLVGYEDTGKWEKRYPGH